jgi:TRAP-type C4-dicarboxylate transport system permease small subunit
MDNLDRIVTKGIEIIRGICSILIGLMLAITTIQVIFRYIFNNPLVWSEEVSLVLLIWFGFLAISNELYHGNHMAIVMFYEKFPAKVRWVIDLVQHTIVALFCGIMIVYLLKITQSIKGNTLPVSGLPKIILYIPVIMSSVLMLFYSILLLVKVARGVKETKGENA